MRCHTIKYNGKKVFIPGCMGGAHNGRQGCTCYPWSHERETVSVLQDRLRHHENEVVHLKRQIEKRTKKPVQVRGWCERCSNWDRYCSCEVCNKVPTALT